MEVHQDDSSEKPSIGGQEQIYQLTFEVRPNYLYALIKSDRMDRTIALEYLTEVAEHVIKLKKKRLMLVRDVPVMLPDSDLFFTTQYFLDKIGKTRVAFVNPHIEIDEDMRFAVLIGTNRGANYDLFSNTTAAEKWLIG